MLKFCYFFFFLYWIIIYRGYCQHPILRLLPGVPEDCLWMVCWFPVSPDWTRSLAMETCLAYIHVE